MSDIGIVFRGLDKIEKRLGKAVSTSVIKSSLKLGAIKLSGWTKENRLTGPRPKYLGVKTGRLRASITVGKVVKRGTEWLTTIGTNVIYARTHEFGSEKRNIPARPFLRPTIEDKNNRREVLNIFLTNINAALRG